MRSPQWLHPRWLIARDSNGQLLLVHQSTGSVVNWSEAREAFDASEFTAKLAERSLVTEREDNDDRRASGY